MQRKPISLLVSALASALLLAFASTPAWSAPDYASSSDIVEPNGFAGVCAVPCYTASIETEVWLPTNPNNPLPLPGNNTYIFRVSHAGGSGPFVPALLNFEIAVDLTQVVAAGYLATSGGVAPSSTQTQFGVVTWDFLSTIAQGESSKLLYVHSPLMPGAVSNNGVSVAGQAGLDASGSALGPLDPPGPQCSLSVEKEGCVVQQLDIPGDACEGKVTSFSFQYTGLGCSASSHLQNPRKVICSGGATGQDPVDIVVSSKKRKRWSWKSGWWGKKRHRKTVFAVESGVHVGDTIVVNASNAGRKKVGSKTYVTIVNSGGGHQMIELDRFHTSCSQPLGPGMVFGSVQITSVTSSKGGTVSLPDPEDEECSTSIDLAPAPHCNGKVKTLELRYMGGDCSQSMNTQSASAAGCTDVAIPSANPVRVILSDGKLPPPYSSVYLDQTMVSGGTILSVDASTIPSCSNSGNLKSVLGFWVKDAVTDEVIQDGFFHTSCSQPLNLGDQFGSLQIFGLNSTNGGSVALGAEVEYNYVVTNPNPGVAENVSLDDDILGNIASGVTIPADSSATFTATALVEVETTNVATVTGQVGGQVCSPGVDSATISLTEAPEEPQICTKKIAATLLKYIGPDIVGLTTVKLVAKSFDDHPVIYSGINLVNGTVLSLAEENGFTIDGTTHGESSLGSKMTIYINGVPEKIHTSCSVPYASNTAAPLNSPEGALSSNWLVVDFTQKMKKKDHDHHHGHHGHHH
ncbi:MAG TPA: hypothetical protein EYG54_10125 [Myxococcales bacterium]|nr:hypothetical protein [Myxococcales bacterium]